MTSSRHRYLSFVFILLILLISSVGAVPPTKEAIAKWKAEGTYDQKIDSWKSFKALGGCAPSDHSPFNKEKFDGNMAAGAVVDTTALLVILVDFDDHVYNDVTHGQTKAGTPQDFDSILLSIQGVAPFNPTGSMTDFYLENSYGQFYVGGGITNWLRMDSSYAYHEGGASGIGSATARSQQLVLNAINKADAAGVNFQDYDNDDDGVIDGLVVIHAGHGAETGQFGIWSHKFHLAGSIGSVVRDNVILYDYTMNPEEFGSSLAPIGVICHEFGHTFGLPDLYDIDYDPPESEGLGRWSLMASGTYNLNGQRPASFDAWCKSQIGFLTLTNVTANMDSVAIPAVEYSPVAYKIQNGTSNPEYWIVENRQRMGFDFNLPGWGLLIYHVDPNAPTQNGSNDDPDRYRVGLEQADGNRDLETTLGNTGDGGDPYPGSTNNREFHDLSIPSDVVYKNPSIYPHLGVWDISNSDSIMYADFDISFSRPAIQLDSLRFDDALGNNDGNLDGGETIRVYIAARNLMRTAFNATATLSTPNPNVSFTANGVLFDATFDSAAANNNSIPITFTLADSTPAALDSFYITISCDSISGTSGNDNEYSRTLGIERTIGTPEILIVDDDRGDSHDATVTTAFSRNSIPANIWHIDTDGVPGAAALQKYPHVFWFTGDSAANVIDATRISRFKSYLDAGGNLFLSTMSGVGNMHTLDSIFLNNYFKAVYTGPTTVSDARGISGSTLGNGSRYRPAAVVPFDDQRQQMNLVSGGEAFLSWVFAQTEPYCGISSSNGFKTVLISFAFESIQDNAGGSFRPKDTLLNRVLAFFNDFPTDIGNDPYNLLPKSFQLSQNYPNPFNPSTTISYTIHSRGSSNEPNRAQLDIYNLLGQKVRNLVDEVQSPGTYSVVWDGTSDSGKKMASGIYFYRLILGEESLTKKMMMIK